MTFDVSNLYYQGRRQRAVQAQNADQIEQRRQGLESISAKFLRQQEADEQAAAEAERQAPLEAAQAEFTRNLIALRNAQRETALALPDDQSVFEDPDQPLAFNTQAEALQYNKTQIQLFRNATPDCYWCDENIAAISQYLERNGRHVIVSAKVLQQVFERLTYLGLLIPRPEVVAAPAPAYTAPAEPVRPTVWDVNFYPYFQSPGGKSSDMISGWNPDGSGERITLSRRAVEQMDLNSFKFFGRPTVQERPEWDKVESLETVARQFSELGGRIR